MRTFPPKNRRGGYSLAEMSVATACFGVLIGAFSSAIVSIGKSQDASSIQSRLYDEGTRAMAEIRTDLQSSGVVTANGVDYPYTFEDGNAEAPFDLHDHVPANKKAGPNDPDFGPNRELIFAMPADANSDNMPDIDGLGQLAWDARDFSYVVVTLDDGETVLQRRSDAVSPEVIARHVERVTFDDAFSAVGEVPLDAIRVRIWFRLRGSSGLTTKYFVESMVRLRNGG